MKENDFLRGQITTLKRQQQEVYDRAPETNEGVYTDEGGRGDYSPHEVSYRREVGNEPGYRRDYDSGYRRDNIYEGGYKEGNYRRESAKRYENRSEKSPEENLVNRKKTVVKVEPVEFEVKKKSTCL